MCRHKFKKNGIEDFIILERRSFMGGTWCQNTYPGAQVDVQSPLYSLSSEPYDWSQMFANQSELEAYTKYIINKHNLKQKTKLNSNVSKIQYNDDKNLWEIYIDENKSYHSKIIINASGPLSTPVIPNFQGINNFQVSLSIQIIGITNLTILKNELLLLEAGQAQHK
jgi:cation diffusion facilitator CzcD-associated flavoprotein CzcO